MLSWRMALRSVTAGAFGLGMLYWQGVGYGQEVPAVHPLPEGANPAPVVPLVDGEIIPAQAGTTGPLSSPNIVGTSQDPRTPSTPGEVNWKQIPRVRPLPRPGNFPMPPTGPGYYSFLELLTGKELQNPPKWPYPRIGPLLPGFFDLDNFSYLDDPNNTEFDYTDPLHRIRLGPNDNWLFVTGGELRGRFENRINDRLTTNDNSFDLGRIRTYGDLWYKDDFRFYIEGIFAGIEGQELDPVFFDVNKADFLNFFMDFKIAEAGGNPAYVRVGRQEMLLGSQRLVSPLDWANTRRTFQGVRAFRQTEKWDVDVFWLQPVVPNANQLDWADTNVNFAGAWGTYRPKKGQLIDTYYLFLDSTNRITQLGVPRFPGQFHTFGGRYAGNEEQLLFDTELAMQLGNVQNRNLVAGMATTGMGWWFKDVKWTPTVWAYYDYASGGSTTSGTANTFYQLFPFGHYYLGWIDYVGRQNIHDLNFHLFAYPTKWVTTWLQFHSFWLANRTDALYSASGQAIRRDPTGRAGAHVGEEVDLVLNFHLTRHTDLFTGYSYLWGGNFLRNTAGPNRAADASFYWLQLSYKW